MSLEAVSLNGVVDYFSRHGQQLRNDRGASQAASVPLMSMDKSFLSLDLDPLPSDSMGVWVDW